MSASDPAADPDAAIARELRLREPPAGVVRLSRRAVAVTAAATAVLVGGVVTWSLGSHPRRSGNAATPPVAAAEAHPPEAVVALPKDYAHLPADVPRLGPPLPGDLGRPMLAGERAREGAGSSGETVAGGGARARPQDTVAASPLFAAGSGSRRGEGAAGTTQAGLGALPLRATPAGHEAAASTTEHELAAGTTLRAALITGIRSDLPGPVLAQLTDDAYDSATGHLLLAPRGSRLIGAYDDKVAFGQDRVFVAWSQLVLPDGRVIALDKAPATDGAGFAGLQDRVDHHWGRLLGASFASLGIAAAGQIGRSGQEDDLVRALRGGLADTAAEAGGQVMGRTLSVRPSLTIRPGSPVRVLLVQGLRLPVWAARGGASWPES